MSKVETVTTTFELNKTAIEQLVKTKLGLSSDKAAAETVNAVLDSVLELLEANVHVDGFKLKIHGFGQFRVVHKEAKMIKVPKTGEKKMGQPKRKIKFVASSQIRQLEKVSE